MFSRKISLPLLHLALLPFLTYLSHAQQVADGAIVPFKSSLPACASKCGPLFDVQGACAPPNIPTASSSCFCGDARLAAFTTTSGTEGVSSVCGATSCTQASDLQSIKTWYQSFCKKDSGSGSGSGTTTTATPGATSTSSGSSTGKSSIGEGGKSWISTHYQWVIMVAVIFFGLMAIWIGACIWRKRYIRKKERAFEMRPPAVPWGPTQSPAMTPPYVDGTADASRSSVRSSMRRGEKSQGVGAEGYYSPSPLGLGATDGGHYKEATAQDLPLATPADGTTENRGSRGWLRKNRP
ncbi:uncharacterized protein BP5553_00032 [Venustampulla echinocandica]|uniref:Integral membrane protein n=1 Tax=Venustampulla echinocandica TaxID=2656787 RepID=A0A370TX05_9HELO|nr:uncharacterized protein BP5553_00032 [Venustampulla echinocandica]RDL40053.1 hypothetical protein BP5553_00032 [Venustampulla echinocandica]